MKTLFEMIANVSREPELTTHTRRFVYRARRHGVTILTPIAWGPGHATVQHGRRAIRIDEFGRMSPSEAFHDEQSHSMHCALHAAYLIVARRHRQVRDAASARAALTLARLQRLRSPRLP